MFDSVVEEVQPTHPCQGATDNVVDRARRLGISIHAPARGATHPRGVRLYTYGRLAPQGFLTCIARTILPRDAFCSIVSYATCQKARKSMRREPAAEAMLARGSQVSCNENALRVVARIGAHMLHSPCPLAAKQIEAQAVKVHIDCIFELLA